MLNKFYHKFEEKKWKKNPKLATFWWLKKKKITIPMQTGMFEEEITQILFPLHNL